MHSLKYTPELNKITGNLKSTIFLEQLMYWFKKMKYASFYKFNSPSKHPFYKEGASWIEDLGMTNCQFKNIRAKISTKLNPGQEYLLHELQLVLYWREYPNLTYYHPNYIAMLMTGDGIFEKLFPHFREWKRSFIASGILLSEVTFYSCHNSKNSILHIQENTQKITSEEKTGENSLSDFFESIEMKNSWNNWLAYQAEKYSKHFSEKEQLTLIKSLEAYSEDFIVSQIQEAIVKGWKHFIFPNLDKKNIEFNKRNRSTYEENKRDYEPKDFFGEKG